MRSQSAGDSGVVLMTSGGQRDFFLSEPEQGFFGEPSDDFARADPQKIRLHLVTLLETARNAKTMPWPERDARKWQIAFRQLANWLPPDEAAQLRFAFAQEMQRLDRAA
jgi:hypothetical protein